MLPANHKLHKLIRVATITTLSFMACWGLLLVLAQIKPFGIDEWRLIYNLKYKSVTGLWGQLELLQQFPRLYLAMLKIFTAPFDYSYFTLRFPSFLVGTATIFFAYRLMNKIYTTTQVNRFLFVLIIVSSHTFTEYFIQVKQYTMELFLSLVAIWQLLQVLKIANSESQGKRRYLLLCISFLIAPFFSYTYPIVIAPVFLIVIFRGISILAQQDSGNDKAQLLMRLWFPFVLSSTGIIVFYITDVSGVMNDNGMRLYWGYLMMQHGFDISFFLKSFYRLFAEIGSGLLLEIIFGAVGLLAFVHATISCAKSVYKKRWNNTDYLTSYCVLLIVLVMILFAAGKLPVGEARLNGFTVPAIALMIISFVEYLNQIRFSEKAVKSVTMILFIAAAGHIFTSSFGELLGDKQHKTLGIYVNTENAIILAQEKKMPIFISSAVAFPNQKIINFPYTNIVASNLCFPVQYNIACDVSLAGNIPGDWVLKTFPAYKVNEHLPVYAFRNLSDLKECIKQLAPEITSVLAGDGTSFRIINR